MMIQRTLKYALPSSLMRQFSSDSSSLIQSILEQVQRCTLSVQDAEHSIRSAYLSQQQHREESLLSSYANIDHHRSLRTGFPEAVFGTGKTPQQISQILDSMALHINNLEPSARGTHGSILATRVTPKLFDEIQNFSFQHGTITYHTTAQIITMTASSCSSPDMNSSSTTQQSKGTVIVACAGTTDLPVAEEAAVTLEATRACQVERIYDVGVAGLHRILSAIPKLRHPNVQCILVVAGMDGALPSVVAGLVSTPVIAIPTSVGYGANLLGFSALLTMLNSCSPGVGVVNIDNGFGGAALAYKILKTKT